MSTYDDASLVLVPSGYKNGVVFSQKPMDANGQLTFTRASDATRVGPNGYIEKVRTNTIPYSQDFSNATWVKDKNGTGVIPVVTSNNATAPDGTMTADTIVFNSGAGTTTGDSSVVYQAITASGLCTSSFYARVTSGTGQLIFRSVAGSTYTTANLTTTWQRFSAAENGSSGFFEIGLRRGLSNEPINSSITAELWGAQLETGDIATDYIPTTTAAVSVGPVSGTPRLDYLGSDCPRLLLEPQRSNLALYSESFDNAAWSKVTAGTATAPVVTANYTTSPDGYQNADRIQFSSANTSAGDFSLILPTATINLTSAGTVTLYVKSLTSGTQNLLMYWGGGQGGVFQVTTEWTRITLSNLSASNTGFAFGTRGGGDYFSGGDTTLDIAVWGAQLEAGAYATSYIPTLGTSVTRVGEECQTTSLQSASLIGATAGTFFIEANKTDDASWFNQRIFLTSTTVRSLLMDTSAGQIRLRTWDAASAGATITTSGLVNGLVKYLIKWDGTNVKVFANGVLVGSSAQPSYAYTTYSAFESASFSNNEINQVLFFPTALSDTQCIELTTL